MPVDISTVKSRRHPRRVIQAPPSETTSESDSDGSVDDTIDEVSPPDVEPGIKINDNPTFALITLPPGITVSSYSAVVRHLEQSRFIFDAFRNVFADGNTLRDFLNELPTEEEQVSYIMMKEKEFYGLSMRTVALFPAKNYDFLCQCLFVSIYSNGIESVGIDQDKLHQYSRSWKDALEQLCPIQDDLALRRIKLIEPYQNAVIKAFNVQYDDPDGLVDFYTRQLVQNMDTWVENSAQYNSPCSSVINSSMMGKSRLLKEIAANIPTVYICVREVDDGYPNASESVLRDYLLKGSHFKPENPGKVNDEASVRGLLALFVALFTHLQKFCAKYGKPKEQLIQFRKELFTELAEPTRAGQNSPARDPDISNPEKSFWELVVSNAQSMDQSDLNRLLDRLSDAWDKIAPFLTTSLGKPMLLIVWDEARSLVNIGLDGQPLGSLPSLISIFRIIRHTLRVIGRHGVNPKLRMFSLFTDTSSRVGNFQPRHDSDSSRMAADPGVGRLMFRPIVLMPTFDHSARQHLKLTYNYHEVQSPKRLIAYGRTAWYIMWQAKALQKPVSFIPLAVNKLFRGETIPTLANVFNGPVNDAVRAKMLACLGPRVAFQTGSFVTVTRGLVASHMMTLLRIGADHDQLEGCYPSEPILAEASAQATAKYGWAKPLEVLVTELRHGVVMKGFRGEFITKVLACMAMEDALRPTEDSSPITKDQKYWQYSRPVTVSRFLANLLRSPDSSSDNEHTVLNAVGKRTRTQMTGRPIKRQKREFDNFDSEEDEEVAVDSADENPKPDSVPSIDNIRTLAKNANIGVAKDDIQWKTLLGGRVFFNHFVVLETTLRPSTLIKAWNRGAALMVKSETVGIDFVIPVVRKDAHKSVFDEMGPMFGEWDETEEEVAASVVSGIWIQTKNRENGGGDSSRHAMETCVPICSSSIDRKKYNVKYHTGDLPNPFVSILMEFGVKPSSGVQIVLPFNSRAVHAKQLPIAAYGLTAETYNSLAPNGPDPVRGLNKNPQLAATVRHCLPLQCHPAHEHPRAKPSARDRPPVSDVKVARDKQLPPGNNFRRKKRSAR